MLAARQQRFSAITSTRTKKGEFLLANISTELKNKNITTNVKLFTTVTVDEPAPGLKTIFSFIALDPSSVTVGTDFSFDTTSGNFTKLNVGLNFTHSDLIASLTFGWCEGVSHSFLSNENTIIIGTQHALDPLTKVKARLNNYGRANALIQHEWHLKLLITIFREVDTGVIKKSAKVGLVLTLKP
ncbi:hypothetical protein J1N35_035454 [Gossypium stocksii]|uniref:Uncharacterized protein n=1 Tax=Gossypium stocksii TaxID=47602 RepID=A0A9D3UUT0_9ROSI|nr:hypothetical protein J1N35_035454 [Gossypium stocksii]